MSASESRLGFALDKQARAPLMWAGLLAAAALGWTVTVGGAIEMGNGPGTMGRNLGGFMLLWIAMMAGMMNLAWMAGLAAVIFLEKSWRFGKSLGIVFGIALLIVAFFVPIYPDLVPGLRVDGAVGSMRIDR